MRGLLFLSLLAFHNVMAQDLGVWGKVYPIEEENLLSYMTERAKMLKLNPTDMVTFINHPNPVDGIVATQEARTRVVDPSIYFQNKTINPLSKVELKTPLLFIDGTKRNQQAWVEAMIQQTPQSKVILIDGNPYALSQQWQRSVYFDQQGQLVKRFKVKVVPTRITQQGLTLCLEEIK